MIEGHMVEDEIVDSVSTETEAALLLNDAEVVLSTSQLYRLIDKGYKTVTLSSGKLTDEFIETFDLSGGWQKHVPLYSNKHLTESQVLSLLRRVDEIYEDDAEFRLRAYLFSGITFGDALLRISKLRLPNHFFTIEYAELFWEARQEDMMSMIALRDETFLLKSDSEIKADVMEEAKQFVRDIQPRRIA